MATKRFDRWRLRFAAIAMMSACAGWATAATDLPAGVSRGPAPSWIDPVDVAAIAPAAASDGVAYVLVDDQVSILGDEPVEYRRLVYDVVDREGLEDAGRTPIGFQPDYQRIALHGLIVERAGARGDRSADVRAELLRRETNADAGMLDGQRTLELFLPDVRVGDRLDISYSVIGRNPVFGDDFHAARNMGYGQGIGMRRIVAFAPASRALFARANGVGYVRDERIDGDIRRLAFIAEPLAPVIHENGAPDWFDGYGHADLSTAADWGAVAAWAAKLFVTDEADRQAIAGVAEELALADAGPRAALLDALAFVQREVRYVSLALGAASHRPANPALTLARRYGDCKDKALLLVGLLREAGVDAQPVLVSTSLGEHVAAHLPTPLAFDHAIVRVRLGGEWVYVDPTRAVEHGTLEDREPMRFGAGLPVAAGTDALATIPREERDAPSIEVEQAVRVADAASRDATDADADASPQAELRVLTRYRHGPADRARARFRSDGPEQVGRDYLGFMASMYEDIRQVTPPSIDEQGAGGVVAVEERYLAPFEPEEGKADAIGNLDLVLFQIADWVPSGRESERRWPLALTGPAHGTQVIRMTAEGGWSIPAEAVTVGNDWFRFDRHVSVDGDVLTIRGEWRRHRDAIPAADYAAARADLRRVRDLLSFPVLIGGGGDEAAPLVLDSGNLAWPAAALLAVALLLSGLWPVRAGNDIAGMFYAPRATTPRLLERRGMPSALLLLVASGFVGGAFDVVPVLVAGGSPDWGRELLLALAMVPREIVFVAVLVVAFRVIGPKARFRPLFVAASWAAWPLLLLGPLALLAAGPAIELFADGGAWPDGPRAVVAAVLATSILLMMAMVVWTVASTIGAIAAAARTDRSTAVAALLLTVFAVFTVAFLIAAALYATGVIPLPRVGQP